jgi:hypothetical protein
MAVGGVCWLVLCGYSWGAGLVGCQCRGRCWAALLVLFIATMGDHRLARSDVRHCLRICCVHTLCTCILTFCSQFRGLFSSSRAAFSLLGAHNPVAFGTMMLPNVPYQQGSVLVVG